MTKKGYSDRVRRIRECLGLKIADFSRQLDVPRSTLIGWEEGKSVSIEILKTLETKFEINLDWFLTGDGEMFSKPQPHEAAPGNKKPIPIFSASNLPEKAFLVPLLEQKLSAGSGADLPEEDIEKGLIPVPSYLSKYGKTIKALTVEGDSMYPTLHRGDMVVCDSCGWSGEGVYAVRMNGKGFVKRVTQRPGKVVLLSDNPKYPPQEEPEESEDIEIVGRVHCAITKVD
jgi:phage repressor protein C with HTH and peptisase S24 domain